MSYILKALKKSEAERAKGAVPRLSPQQTPTPRTRGAIWPWVVGAALIVNATVVVFAAWGPEMPLRSVGQLSESSAPVAAGPAPEARASVAAVTAAAPEAPVRGNGSATPRSVGSEQPVNGQTRPAEPDDRTAGRPAVQTPAPQRSQADQPQIQERAQAGERQAQQQRQAVQPQAQQQRQAAQPQVQQQRQAAQSQVQQPGQAAQRQDQPVVSVQQDAQATSVSVGQGDANDAGKTQASDAAVEVAPPPIPRAQVARAPDKASPPIPTRKPRRAMSQPERRPVLGDPIQLGTGIRAPKVSQDDLALAAPELQPPEPEVVEAEPPPEPEPDLYAGVPMLWQLPSSIRSTLPKLSMSVHVYSPEAEGRFVIVDRSKYREGDVMAGGVKLEAIVADGIVLDYQGRRYRIGN